jgi:hypothetical protein
MMGGEDMVFIYILIGFFIALGLLSAWNIVQILWTNYTVRKERDRYLQERADFENRPKGR